MQNTPPRLPQSAEAVGRNLILDELFDLTLYESFYEQLSRKAGKNNAGDDALLGVLENLIPVERRHLEFWQSFFGKKIEKLNFSRRVKRVFILALSRMLGSYFIGFVLEAIEIYGIKKYFSLWGEYKDTPFGGAVRGVLDDELEHENDIVLQLAERRINPERVRNFFLGFNDGLVEILGAVSGFFAALQDTLTVLVAGLMVAVAGSISMAAGAFVAASSESEMRGMEKMRSRFIGKQGMGERGTGVKPIASSITIGVSYFVGAAFPLLPVFFGARAIFSSLVVGGGMIIGASFILALLSGMNIRKRIALNLLIMVAAVSISYGIGLAVKSVFGVSI